MRARHTWPAALAVAAALALTGCSADSSDDQAATSSAGGAPAAEKAAEPGTADRGGPAAADTAAKAPNLQVDQRSIIYTGSITLRVKDVNQDAARVLAIASGAGGFVGSDKRSSGDTTDAAEATIELRVPADKFQSVVDQIAGLGEEEQRSVNTQDVTEEVLDLGARIASQQARVDSGRRLLAQAKNLEDLVMLESELAKREADLASLQAKQKRLADLTALSTITVVLLDPGAPGAPAGDDEPTFLSGLAAGWDALVASLRVLLTIVGALLPWLIALGLPLLLTLWLIRRLRRTPAHPAPQVAPATYGPPAPPVSAPPASPKE
ncbi:DUF4349 domain-containing protein [Spirilliplanes yamanashiensis]|uniref:DUF4349 domain-containing protein n=1 Tax=Spirilliplanes yamanashiensis TaxID=42233 RepID=A0A8J3Y3M1_9ACTN|nr:DUF4349 domain-containing protein [Spirilliplanes yamanashiensis]MDP9814159.1 hypothetical protein [Spirilliplanes yamanashiensis]GIJ00859.1 hypothetical protein Sya03_02110 [Spirilliplanes yamanashiensis]